MQFFFTKIPDDKKHIAKNFLINYCKSNYKDSEKVNVVVDIARHSFNDLFEEILYLFISLSQEKELFSEIYWRGNGGTVYSGEINIGDIKAAEWRDILSTVEKSSLGIKLIPIKQYITEQVESNLRYGDWERQRRFLENY